MSTRPQVQCEYAERANRHGTGRPDPSRVAKFSASNGDQGKVIFSTSKIDNYSVNKYTIDVQCAERDDQTNTQTFCARRYMEDASHGDGEGDDV